MIVSLDLKNVYVQKDQDILIPVSWERNRTIPGITAEQPSDQGLSARKFWDPSMVTLCKGATEEKRINVCPTLKHLRSVKLTQMKSKKVFGYILILS